MSDRPAQKFQIGEQVIVQAEHYQTFDGVVLAVEWRRNTYSNATCMQVGPSWCYQISPDLDGVPWRESALRKKPNPSTQSFAELLQSIQQPNKVKA